jgi:hypothetical protein
VEEPWIQILIQTDEDPLTETGTESGKTHNTEVIENFETFPEITSTPSSDQQFRSYGH